jgi:hypothetical protein
MAVPLLAPDGLVPVRGDGRIIFRMNLGALSESENATKNKK